MKTAIALAFCLFCMIATAQKETLPPVITVHLSMDESARLAQLQQKVIDAQAALSRAQGDISIAQYEIIKSHRTKEIGPDPMCSSPMFNTSSFLLFDSKNLAVQSIDYAGRIEGDWIIFDHNIPICKGA